MAQVLPLAVNTLLNGLDAATYGQLLLSQEVWPAYPGGGPATGIALYLLSTAVSQFLLPLISSFPRGVAACTMVETVPFLAILCKEVARMCSSSVAIRSTIAILYGLLAALTAMGFLVLQVLQLERTVHQVPRAVLLGTMAGVGIFLVRAGIRMVDNVVILGIGMIIAGVTVFIERTLCPPFLTSIVSIGLIMVFYAIVLLFRLDLDVLRDSEWLPVPLPSLNPLTFYTSLSPSAVHWSAIVKLAPTLLSAALFGMIHVPINVPSYARYSGLPFRMSRELVAHVASNAASALIGTCPTYMAYANSILFLKSGASDRITSVALAGTTLLLLIAMPIMSYIPTILMIFLSCNLGLDLLYESIISPIKLARLPEYGIIGSVATITTVFGFAQGLLVGFLLTIWLYYSDRRRRGEVAGHVPRSTITIHIRSPDKMAFLRSVEYRCLHRVSLPPHSFFGNSIQIIDSLNCHPADTIITIIDMTHTITLDLNMVEGLIGFCRRRKVVFVDCPVPQLVTLASSSLPNFQMAMNYCEECLLRMLNDSRDIEEEPLLSNPNPSIERAKMAARQAAQIELEFLSLFSHRIEKDSGETLTSIVLLRLDSGTAQLIPDDYHVLAFEPGAWILPKMMITCITDCTFSVVEAAPTSEAFIFLTNMYSKLWPYCETSNAWHDRTARD